MRAVWLLLLACACGPESVESFHERCGYDEWISQPAPTTHRRIVAAVPPSRERARQAPSGFVFAGPDGDYEAIARAFHESKPAQFDRFEGPAICAVAPTHPETLDPYHFDFILFQLRGRGRPDLVAKGHMGATSVSWGPETRDVAYFTQRVTLATGDKIDLDVSDEDFLHLQPVGHVSGTFRGASPIELADKNVRVTCNLWTPDAWEARRKAALAALEADVSRVRATPLRDAWLSSDLLRDIGTHVATYDVYGSRDDADRKRADAAHEAAAGAWWSERSRGVDAHHEGLGAAGQWRTIDGDFEGRVPGLACFTGYPVSPHCQIAVEIRARREGTSACGIVGEKIASLKMSGVVEDGTTTSLVISRVYRSGRAIASLHDLDDLHAGEIVTVDLYTSAAEAYDDRTFDVATAEAVPWRVRAVRVGTTELRVY